jgi:cytochrome bd-type quinol oxidase subunit 2
MLDIFSAFGLSAATGLNAYLPLLIVGLIARFTDLITLKSPWDTLENPWVLGVLGVLLLIEITVDKIPAVDTVNDAIQTVVRPAAGAILFAASANAISKMSPVVAMICGLLMAGGVHAAKATVRPVITATTAGVGNPVVSTVEDVVSGTTTLAAIFAPAVAAVIVLLTVGLFAWWYVRRRRARAAQAHRAAV